MGEYAIHKLFFLPYDPEPLPGGDNGIDLILPGGESVQIKYRAQRGWDFLLQDDKPTSFKADIGILLQPANEDKLDDSVEVVGWVSREAFLQEADIKNYLRTPKGNRLGLSQEHFRPIEELLREIWKEAS